MLLADIPSVPPSIDRAPQVALAIAWFLVIAAIIGAAVRYRQLRRPGPNSTQHFSDDAN